MRRSLLILFLLPLAAVAQHPVAPVNGWRASVDTATQQIVLGWHPSADSAAMGYHICTGSPCLDYDTVFGRFDTSYICLDHSPLEAHTYRLHVFDSARNVSSLTPPFGNMVLTAEVPECERTVSLGWTPYVGNPSGPTRYNVQVRQEPFDNGYTTLHYTTDSSRLHYSFDIATAVTRIWLRIEAVGDSGLQSFSNTVMVERRTVDTASVVEIGSIEYDSINTAIRLGLQTDPAFSYTLYRSIDGTPWREVATVNGASFTDRDINPFDSLHCYQLGVLDACGMNERFSSTTCIVVPDPPAPKAWFPNAIVAGDERNGTFLPKMRGLKGDLYELSIYNRQGLLVYHTQDPNAGWTPPPSMPKGAYTYFLRCRYNTNDIKTYAGTVTLIR